MLIAAAAVECDTNGTRECLFYTTEGYAYISSCMWLGGSYSKFLFA